MTDKEIIKAQDRRGFIAKKVKGKWELKRKYPTENKDIKEYRILLAKYGSPITDNPYGYKKAREKEKAIETFWLEKLAKKDQVINKLIEDRPFDIKDALAEQKEEVMEYARDTIPVAYKEKLFRRFNYK